MSVEDRCSVDEVYTFEAKDFGRFKEATKVFFAEDAKKYYQHISFAYQGETKAVAFALFDSVELFLESCAVAFPFKEEVLKYSKIVSTDIFGTPADTKKWQESPHGDAVKATARWFVLNEGGFVHGKTTPTSVRMAPFLKVKNMDKVQAMLPKLLEATKTEGEDDCLHYGFSICDQQNILHCRYACPTAEAAIKHLAVLRDLLISAKEQDIWEIAQYNVVGPREEVDKLKGPTAANNPDYYYTD